MPLDWFGDAVVIIGSGPSAPDAPLEAVRGRAKVIAINNSWKLAPWADMLFGCDGAWWFHHRGVPGFKGRRITASPAAAKKFNIDLFASVGNNSGIRAIYLAEKLGAAKVLLVGFDMHAINGVHWHEPHPQTLANPGPREIAIWREDMERIAKLFAAKAMQIINCTPGSALKCFPYMPLIEAMDGDHNSHSDDRQRHPAVAV